MGVNGVGKENSVIFLMDDKKSIPERRQQIAGMIHQAIDQGAKMIVVDVFFTSQTSSDIELQEAFDRAALNNIPIIVAAPPDGSGSAFINVTLGHVIAKTKGGWLSLLNKPKFPNSTQIAAREKLGDQEYESMPLLVVKKLCSGGLSNNMMIGVKDYRDLTEEELPPTKSYNDYPKTDLKGMVVFIGGTSAPVTGQKVDQTTTDDGRVSHGIFDIVSATFALSSVTYCGEK